MSYMRGDYYTYHCGDTDAPEDQQVVLHGNPSPCGCGDHAHMTTDKRPSISLPVAVYDSLAVMRVAELIEDGTLKDVVAATIAKGGGNFGAQALFERCGYDPMGDFIEEMHARQDAHLLACVNPDACGSPGFHRHERHVKGHRTKRHEA